MSYTQGLATNAIVNFHFLGTKFTNLRNATLQITLLHWAQGRVLLLVSENYFDSDHIYLTLDTCAWSVYVFLFISNNVSRNL